MQQRQVKDSKPPFPNLVDNHCFPLHCTITRTTTPKTMPIVPLLQNLFGAFHNAPRHDSQSHPACIRTLKHCITILFEEQ